MLMRVQGLIMFKINKDADEFSTLNISELSLEPLPKVVDTRGFMYIVSDKAFPGWLKIGRTVDPKKRLQAYNSDKPFPTATYDVISACFDNVIEVERVILEKMYEITPPSTASKEWFEKIYGSEMVRLIELAEEKYDVLESR